MKKFSLQPRQDSAKLLAPFFLRAGKKTSSGGIIATLEVSEDTCFKDNNWLSVGEIELHPGEHSSVDENECNLIERAILLGSYDWRLPPFKDIVDRAKKTVIDSKEENTGKLERVVEAIAQVAMRCGFAHPVFDAGSISNMPFRKPTTVVADTSSVMHGGLDFIVRFLYPFVRIKIPAVVHMEILNIVDRFLTKRRGGKATVGTLLEHVNSQGCQRVLLRLELQTDAEIERPRLGADPLRGIIQPGSDAEDKALNLGTVQKSFADRLILETAIQHREKVGPDHPVMLLTCDQGLARMTLGEGFQPLFFDKNYFSQLFGTVLTGTCFSPFSSLLKSDRLYFIPLPDLIWELAVTFGSARIANEDHSANFQVCAIGKDLSWSPFHAKDDLLWVKREGFDGREIPSGQEREGTAIIDEVKQSSVVKVHKSKNKVRQDRKPLKGSYKFSLTSMLLLMQAFIEKQVLTDDEGIKIVGVKTLDNYGKYRNFLRSGNFIALAANGRFAKTEYLDKVWGAIMGCDYQEMEVALSAVKSFKQFKGELLSNRCITGSTVTSVAPSNFSTYCALAEMVCIGLYIPEEGLYDTFHRPTLEEFSEMAIKCYVKISQGEEFVLTGQWLETMAKDYRVHPVFARSRLNEAHEARYLERYTEGSTPETQFEKHVMTYLNIKKGIPVIEKMNLYYGDFILPDRASVSIKIIKGER